MSNKKETPVSWLVQRIVDRQNGVINEFPIYSLDQIFEQALQMESQKQQKYDEMLAMLERFLDREYLFREMEQLIKEAKEL
jgi:hypothetical protein